MATTEQPRPSPEHFLSLIRQQQRGRLKVYLGFAPGVGKTYEMLQEGQRLKRQGVDVVLGVVETHGRADTAAQIGDVEQVPRRRIEYRGVVLDEMDLDAVLKRHPAVLLVDDWAMAGVTEIEWRDFWERGFPWHRGWDSSCCTALGFCGECSQ